MRKLAMIVAGLCLAFMSSPATAQDEEPERPQRDRVRMRLSPERAEAAWTMEVKCFAAHAQLDEETTTKLTEIYIKARKDFNAALREARQGDADEPGGRQGGRGNRGGGDPQRLRELLEEHRGKFAEAIDGMMGDQENKRARMSLGALSAAWDVMTDGIIGFDLGDEQSMTALKHVEDFIVETSTLRESGDVQTMREGMREARDTLVEQLEEILSDEQMDEMRPRINAAFGGRRGGAGRPGRPGGGQGGGQGQGGRGGGGNGGG